ncbi:MAG TPA: hypothetical protein VHS06_02750, partial [Chloroflexota bacterium]|nr:hypothetical protein [Chloroflexota bacterium]
MINRKFVLCIGTAAGIVLLTLSTAGSVFAAPSSLLPYDMAPTPPPMVLATSAPSAPQPTATPAPTKPAAQPTAAPAATAAPTAVLGASPSQAPAKAASQAKDPWYFEQTGFKIANDRFWDYFNKRGGVGTFGYPISKEFLLFGFRVQLFQRALMQLNPDGSVATMNLLEIPISPMKGENDTVNAYIVVHDKLDRKVETCES